MAQDWLQGKSPKMWINEICVKQLRQAKWETREAHPGQTPPKFICRCTIHYSDKTLEAEGSGKTKKDAEQEAALEMLKSKLNMTPVKLMALNSSSKKKSAGGSSSSSINGDGGGSSENCRGDNGDPVSDTDSESTDPNPISELMAICEQHEMQEPEYTEVNEEGPPHKRIFTIRCTVQGTNLLLTDTGRRYTKKLAKRVAAFRVLKKVKKEGYTYTPHTTEDRCIDSNGAEDGDDDTKMNANKPIQFGKHADINDEDILRKLVLREPGLGLRLYCNDQTEKCVEYCVNYAHAFQHLKKSLTLDKILTLQCTEPFTELGGAIPVLEQIAREMGIKLTMYLDTLETAGGEVFGMLELKFPFHFNKTKLPNKAVIHALEQTKANAKNVAATNAINWMKSSFTSVSK